MANRLVLIMLFFLIGLLATVGYLYTVPGASDPTAVAHPQYEHLLVAAPNQPKLVGPGYAMGYLMIAVIACCVLLGWQKTGSLARVGVWLIAGFVVYLLVYTGLMVTYAGYQAGPDAAFFGGYPVPTAWMIYGVWLFPVCFIVFYYLNFASWFMTERAMKDFGKLLEARTNNGEGGA